MCTRACRWVQGYALALLCLLTTLPASAAAPLWESRLPEAATWHRLTGVGTLLAGTASGLLSLDPDSGQLLWRRDDLAGLTAGKLHEIEGLPLLVVSEYGGDAGRRAGPTAIDYITGETAWRAEPGGGRILGLYPVPERNLLVLFETAGAGTPDEPGVYVRGLQASDGAVLWRLLFRAGADPLTLYPPEATAAPSSPPDLGGHPEPVVADGMMYVPFDGLAAIDLAAGQLAWDFRYETADRTYQRAYPAPLVAGEQVFAGGRHGTVYAVERASGRVHWQGPEVRAGLLAQLLVTADTVFARVGGNFYSQKERRYLLRPPLGVIALDRASGSRRWEYLAARDGMTNLVYLADRRAVVFADGHDIVGLQADASPDGKAVESFRVPIEFKRRITGVELAAKGMQAVSGLFKGGLTGAKRSMSASGTLGHDVPLVMQPLSDGRLLLRGQQHLLMFDPKQAVIQWSTHYPAPRVPGSAIASMAALGTVSAARSAVGRLLGSDAGHGQAPPVEWGRLEALASRRDSAGADAGRYTYVLTDVEADGRRGVGIMAIDMADGAPATQVLFGDLEPDYRIDEVIGRVYYFKDHRDAAAFALR